MNKSNQSTFEHCALASGLLTTQQLADARARLRWADGDEPDTGTRQSDQQLADRVVEMGLLNPWQAKQLLDGRTKFTLGAYRIIDSIGQGGMGQVFKAVHNILGRVVAVKVLPLSKSTPEAITNFTNEIRTLAMLDHKNLVRALDDGQDGNVYFLVTEYVPGADLRKLVRRDGPLDMRTAAGIICQVAAGLEHAHQRGLIHRDVKPGNVLVTPEGEAKLSDLGLAGPLEGDAESDPRFGKIVGTADYISPDHVESPWDPTPAWDIYSLGCTFYYAVTGKVPFPGGSTSDKARAHCELRPLDPRRLNTGLSTEFVDVMADMMAKDPAQRIQSASEVTERLTQWLEGRPSEATMAVPPPPKPPPIIATPPGFGSPATPPPVRPPTLQPGSPEPAFPEMSAPDDEDSSSQVVEITDLPRPTAGPAAPAQQAGAPGGPASILYPVLILALAPLALLGAAMLIWLAVKVLL